MKLTRELLDGIRDSLETASADSPQVDFPKPEVLLSWFQDRKTIRDPIYDQIMLNELERAVLRTAEFQRLRSVKQMDFAYLVYPAAEHSRFTHSLGVCQAAKDLFDKIMDNFEKREILRRNLSDAEEFERSPVPDFCVFDRVLVSLAALLHDLGHPPFSHAFDMRDDLLEHDNFETNPFVLRALFDTSTSELAKTLKRWDPYFKVLMRAEAPQQFSGTAAVEGVATELPCLATLVVELLAVKASDDLGTNFRCLCPGTERKTIESTSLEKQASKGWSDKKLSFELLDVKTSPIFRRMHCDIVANTISADLLDYIRRDTRIAGLPRDLDRRFYSFISCSTYRGKSRVVVELEDRQGHVRRDVLSDLMNCMEMRYIIHERIVLHRAVVCARAMAARLYGPAEATLESCWPIVEQMYGAWNQWLSDGQVLAGNVGGADFNADIAALLRRRSLYRPIVILDAERSKRHNVTVPDDARRRLASKFGGQADKLNASESGMKRNWSKLIELETRINNEVLGDLDEETRSRLRTTLGDAPVTFSVCMKPSVLFKNPRIMVRVPTSLQNDQGHQPSPRVQVLDDWLSQVIALNTYESDPGTCAQIHALNARYAELWRLYVFAHPLLFEQDEFRPLLSDAKARWETQIVEEAAIPAMPTTVGRDDLRPISVLDRLNDKLLDEACSLTNEKFPRLPWIKAIEFLRQPEVDVRTAVQRLKSKTSVADPMVGTAAKGGTITLPLDQLLEEFKACVLGSDDNESTVANAVPETPQSTARQRPARKQTKKKVNKNIALEKTDTTDSNIPEGDTDGFELRSS